MISDLDKYRAEVSSFKETSPEKIENFRIKYLGKEFLMIFLQIGSSPCQ